MIIQFKNTELKIPELKNQSIDSKTPQVAFVKKHKADIEKEMGAIEAILRNYKNINIIVDGMAGSGFSGRIFESLFPESKLILNDLSTICYDTLCHNFKKDIQNTSADTIKFGNNPIDLVFIDFNNFTLNTKNKWVTTFEHVVKNKPRLFLFTDSTSFCFKFGKVHPDEYYSKLNKWLNSTYGYFINEICIFGNAALILTSQKKKKYTYIEFTKITYSIHSYKGFF